MHNNNGWCDETRPALVSCSTTLRVQSPLPHRVLFVASLGLPIIIGFAIQLCIPGITGMVKIHSTNTAQETVLVPAHIRYSHQVPVVDLVSTSLADLVVLLTLYSIICRERKRGDLYFCSSSWLNTWIGN